MVKLKPLRGAFSKEEGEYLTERVRGGVVEKPFKLGNKVVWYGEARAAREQEVITDLNKKQKELHYKRNIKKNRELRKQGVQVKTVKEQEKLLTKERAKAIKKASSENYVTTTRDYLARMPKIVEGMKRSLHGDAEFKKAMKDFLNEFEELTWDEKMRFYEANRDLFIDMSDYYNYIREQNQKPLGKETPEGFESVEQYRQTRLDEIDDITQRLRYQKEAGQLNEALGMYENIGKSTKKGKRRR